MPLTNTNTTTNNSNIPEWTAHVSVHNSQGNTPQDSPIQRSTSTKLKSSDTSQQSYNMSIANTIPEELITKITIMSYQLHPHPLATILKDKYLFIENINKLITGKYNLYHKIADVPSQAGFMKSFMYDDLNQEIYSLTYWGGYNKSGIIKELNRQVNGSNETPIPEYIEYVLIDITEDNDWEPNESDDVIDSDNEYAFFGFGFGFEE